MIRKKFIRSAPHLPVRNLGETIHFYRTVLGFEEEWTFGDKDGGVGRDDLRLLFFENPDHVTMINNQNNRLPLLWFTSNIDSIYKEFKERKISISSELKDHPYGMREFAFVDINGYYIRVAEEKK